MTVKEDFIMLRTSPTSSASTSPASVPAVSAAQVAAFTAAAAAVNANSRMAAAAGLLPGMLSGADRYITPEYLAPLPPNSGDKTGKSPLQLLAQTCSQIGADTGNNKLDKSSSNGDSNKNKSSRSPALIVSDPTTTSLTPSVPKPVSFKPYEKDVSKMSPKATSVSPHGAMISPTLNGKSPSPHHHNNNNRMSPVKDKGGNTTTPAPKVSSVPSSSAAEVSPVIRSGLEVLAGHHAKDPYRMPPGAGLDPANPAFRPPYGAAAHMHASMGGFPGSGVCRDPYCRDPSCATAVYNAQLASLSAAGLPQSYLQMAAAAAAMQHTPTTSASAVAAAAAAAAPPAAGGPYICNWMNGREGYCGKRHTSAEELLQHLRTHTNLSTNDSSASAAAAALLSNPSAAAAAAAASLYPPSLLAAGLHRTGAYPSSLAASSSRFHPYGKPGGGLSNMAPTMPPSLGLGALGGMPHGLPPGLAGLGAAAYSPAALYALYGSRLAGAP